MDQPGGTSRLGYREKTKLRATNAHKYRFSPLLRQPGFVAVQHRLIIQLLFQLLTGLGHGGAGLLPTLLRAAQTHRNAQHVSRNASTTRRGMRQ